MWSCVSGFCPAILSVAMLIFYIVLSSTCGWKLTSHIVPRHSYTHYAQFYVHAHFQVYVLSDFFLCCQVVTLLSSASTFSWFCRHSRAPNSNIRQAVWVSITTISKEGWRAEEPEMSDEVSRSAASVYWLLRIMVKIFWLGLVFTKKLVVSITL